MSRKSCLIIDNKYIIAEMVSLVVESFYDMKCLLACDGDEALKMLHDENLNLALVICDYSLPKINGGQFYKTLKENYPNIPFILNTIEPLENLVEFKNLTVEKDFYYVEKPFSHQQLIATFISALNDSTLIQDHEYIPVGMKYFKVYHHLMKDFDVFIKISDQKIIKFSNQGDNIDLIEVEKYEDKNLDCVHFMKDDFTNFSITIFNTIFQNLDNKKISLEDKVSGQIDAVAVTHNLLRNFGVNQSVIKMAKKTVAVTLEEINKNPQLDELLNHIKNRNDYKSKLSTLSSYIATILGSNIQWCKIKNLRKLAYASLFQDVSLYTPVEDFSPDILDTQSEAFKQLNSKEKEMIKEHPLNSLVLIEGLEDLNEDIKSIIVQHHEKPDGSGYPRGLNSSTIAPLSTISILANELAHQLIVNGHDVNKDELLENFQNNFSSGNFKNSFPIFKKIFF